MKMECIRVFSVYHKEFVNVEEQAWKSRHSSPNNGYIKCVFASGDSQEIPIIYLKEENERMRVEVSIEEYYKARKTTMLSIVIENDGSMRLVRRGSKNRFNMDELVNLLIDDKARIRLYNDQDQRIATIEPIRE